MKALTIIVVVKQFTWYFKRGMINKVFQAGQPRFSYTNGI